METVEKLERVVALEGGRNFRDLGGYETADGRRLKWGKLYRSGSMGGLTDAAYARLAELGVRFICDLRTSFEREEHPVDWGRVPNLSYWTRDYQLSFGDMRKLFASGQLSVEDARAAMVKAYQHLPFEQAPSYTELFRRMAAGEAPLVFNCSAGKDRTGVAAALILSALGVPEETILEDFLLTNATLDRAMMMRRPQMSNMDAAVATVLLSVEPEYIHAALAAVREAHGSVPGYLEARLGVSADDLRSIEALFLE